MPTLRTSNRSGDLPTAATLLCVPKLNTVLHVYGTSCSGVETTVAREDLASPLLERTSGKGYHLCIAVYTKMP